jgi:hypothetical protein
VQALTPALFPCYGPADRALASTIAEFLQRTLDLRLFLEEGELRPGENLASKARDAQTADLVLVLFSRHSLPPRWPRSEWEEAFVNEPAAESVRIAFVKCDDCVPPRVLTPVFDASLHGLRRIKRWVLEKQLRSAPPAPDAEVLGIAIADRPGLETTPSAAAARQFLQAFRDDFDAAFTLDFNGRGLAALAGDLAAQAGLRLEGDLETNLERLREFCSPRRFLIACASTDAEDIAPFLFGGRNSTLIVTEPGAALQTDIDDIHGVQRAFTNASDWPEMCALARQGRRLMRDAGRIAECFELMQEWHDAADLRDDRAVLDESAREMVWILESWGRDDEARTLEYRRTTEFGDQMSLF